jgi:hypothetical protein
MKKHFLWSIFTVILLSVTIISWKPISSGNVNTNNPAAAVIEKNIFEKYVDEVYQTAQLAQTGLGEDVFRKAVTGFINLKLANKVSQTSGIITVVDFNKPSREKRMWIVDLLTKHLLINTWVAHGQGSGNDMANNFSNIDDSHKSSLGFFIADDVYFGKHGRSLRLDGMDEGFNDAARAREIVVHAAGYVGESTIAQLGRLGRSWGCPAVSPQVSNQVIDAIKGKTVFFINGNDNNYTSKYLDEANSTNYLFADTTANTKEVANL